MSDHTPAPWKAEMRFGEWCVRQDPKDWDGKGYQHICVLPASKKGTHYGEMFAANARVIAAAPEAISELERVTDLLGTWANDHPTERTAEIDAAIHCARSVIAKAK